NNATAGGGEPQSGERQPPNDDREGRNQVAQNQSSQDRDGAPGRLADAAGQLPAPVPGGGTQQAQNGSQDSPGQSSNSGQQTADNGSRQDGQAASSGQASNESKNPAGRYNRAGRTTLRNFFEGGAEGGPEGG